MQTTALTRTIQSALDLEELDLNLFRSKELWRPPGARAVFGGQVVGQALVAALKTVQPAYTVHSLHAYFLLPGDPTLPIIYEVRRVRDGTSFCTRTVVASQRARAIFTCELSFHKGEKGIYEHQFPMPKVPPPESLPSFGDVMTGVLKDPNIPKPVAEALEKRLAEPVPIDLRSCAAAGVTVDLKRLISPPKNPSAKQCIWMRANGSLTDDLSFHQCVAAYASDHQLLSTALTPHGVSFYHPRLRIMTSLDHCVWFHAPFRADEWLLYEMESPRLNGNRGVAFGRIFTQDGRLVMTTAQEGLIRFADKPARSPSDNPENGEQDTGFHRVPAPKPSKL